MMMPLWKWLESGGITMDILFFGMAPLVAISGLFHVILASRKSLAQLCLFLALTLGGGILVTSVFRSHTAEAVGSSKPEEHLGLAAAGYSEANRPFELSLAIVVAGLLPFTIGEFRRSNHRGR